ncbi:tubulin polymerization-promoting protein family member 2 isoform 2-T3 [Liasis olivaceus]
MAALESVSGEEAMADLNPSLDGESWAATDDGGLETNQLTSAEKVALADSAKALAVWEYQWQSDKVVIDLSVPWQSKIISVRDEEAISQSSKQINYNNQTKNLYFCDRHKKDFQWPSLLAQHKNIFCAIQMTDQRIEIKNLHICDQCGKEYQWLSQLVQHQLLHFGGEADRQDQLHLESRNPSPLVPVPILLQENNTCASSWITFQQMLRDYNTHAKRLYLGHHSGKDFCRSAALVLHNWYIFSRRELAGQSQSKLNQSNPLSLVPQMTENLFADSCETSNLNSMLMSLYTGKQHIFDQWGRWFHCLCAQQQLEHLEWKANRDELFHLRAYNPKNSMPILLQAEKTFSENSKIFIEQKNYAKNLYICSSDRKDFQCHCLLARHCPHVPLGEKADTQDQFNTEASSLSQLQVEIKVIRPSRLQSNQTTNQGSHVKSLGMCEECGKDFRWPSALARHQVVHSGKTGRKQCPSKIDGQNGLLTGLIPSLMEFDQPSHLKTNQWTEKNKSYGCSCCRKSFQYPSDLARHERTHSRNKSVRGKCTKLSTYYTCGHCGKSFQYSSSLARHERIHSRKKLMQGKCAKFNKSYTCGQCGKSFQWPSDLARHEHTHSRNKSVKGRCTKLNTYYTCGHCGKSFQYPSGLARHERTHSRKKLMRGECAKLVKSCICDQCGKSFQWPSDLARHERTHFREMSHRDKCMKLQKLYVCTQCRKNFQQLSLLAQHKCTHSREILAKSKCTKFKKSHICGECGRGFQWPSDLARHERIHSKVQGGQPH